MQYFLRFSIALLTFITGVAVWSALKPSEPTAYRITKDDSLSVTISPVRFYEWRRSKVQFTPSAGEDDEALTSCSYHQVEAWDFDATQTGYVDVVCRLENHGSQPVELVILATGDIRLKGVGGPRLEPFVVLATENIGQQVVHQLEPGEVREVKFANFNLKESAAHHVKTPDAPGRSLELGVNVNVMRLEDNVLTAWAGGHLPLTRAH
jgi:hypothetical protein